MSFSEAQQIHIQDQHEAHVKVMEDEFNSDEINRIQTAPMEDNPIERFGEWWIDEGLQFGCSGANVGMTLYSSAVSQGMAYCEDCAVGMEGVGRYMNGSLFSCDLCGADKGSKGELTRLEVVAPPVLIGLQLCDECVSEYTNPYQGDQG